MEHRRQPQDRSDRLGVAEAGRNVDGRGIGQRHHRTDARYRRQPPADRIIADDGQKFAVKRGKRLAQLAARLEQRFDDFGQIGHSFGELADAGLELDGADHPNLETEVAQQPADVVFDGDRLILQEFARHQQGPALLARQRLDMDRAKQVDAHHLGNATGVNAVGFVRLRLQEGLGVAGFDAYHRQAGFGQAAEQPLRQWPGFKPG